MLLDDVRVLLTEFVPMGSNEMVAFCDKLGARERVPGGMYSALQNVDSSDFSNEFDMVVGVDAETKTKIRVLDADETSHVNVEADLLELGASKTNAAATQIEHFGIGGKRTRVISYGLVVNGPADRVKENISLDLLARLLCDAHEDTSMLVANLFSVRQRAMLHCAFKGEPDNRDKSALASWQERATPKLDAWSYMDGEEMENELKQIIGSTYFAHDLGEGGEVLIFGQSRGANTPVKGREATSQTPRRALRVTGAFDVFTTRLRTVFRADGCSQCHATFGAESREKSDEFGKIRERLAEHASTATHFVRDSSLRRRIVGGVRRVSRASGGRRGRRIADVIRRVTPERIVEAFTATRGGHGKSSRLVFAPSRRSRTRIGKSRRPKSCTFRRRSNVRQKTWRTRSASRREAAPRSR